eukprot:CAMPEP_0178445030 /NCGR_PEP_ID=MMETSP0689_2-20121128/39906_1 /TAXON_ID=160604 /ORGANISM="Amphidinium massartii, Strain CS-259" /LENGTH=61 /DNA_ID=CAMNT_0020069467 /DNA_START=29 /DNA_END=211 /DNA_ORIENTATION=+
MAGRGVTSPYGEYGGLKPAPQRQEETQERLQRLGVTGEDVQYEQFVKAVSVQRSMFRAENK